MLERRLGWLFPPAAVALSLTRTSEPNLFKLDRNAGAPGYPEQVRLSLS